MATLLRNHAKGYPWRHAMPPGYELSVLGVLIFMAGGIGDMIWHELFGIEVDVEALLSPTHLILALGATLIIGGPFRAGWRRLPEQGDPPPGWLALLPQLLSLTFLWSLWSFLTQFAHPLVDPWAAAGYRPPGPRGLALLRASLGIAGFLLQTGLMLGLVLSTMRRWALPLGSLTLVLGLNATLMSFMHDQYRFIPAAAPLQAWWPTSWDPWLKPSIVRSGALRVFAFAVPWCTTPVLLSGPDRYARHRLVGPSLDRLDRPVGGCRAIAELPAHSPVPGIPHAARHTKEPRSRTSVVG